MMISMLRVLILIVFSAAPAVAAPYTLTFDYPNPSDHAFKTEGGIRWLYDNCYEGSNPSQTVEVHDDFGCGSAGGFVQIEATPGHVFDALHIQVIGSRSLILMSGPGYPPVNFDGFVFAGETRDGGVVRRSMRTGVTGGLDLDLHDLVALTIAPDDEAIAPYRQLCFDPEESYECPEDGNWNVQARFDDLALDIRAVPIPPAWGFSLIAMTAVAVARRRVRVSPPGTLRATLPTA